MPEMPASRLPDSPEYWDDLARRVRADAAVPLAACAAVSDDWFAVLARRAPWLVTASAAAIVALILVLTAADAPASATWTEGALTPREPAGALVAGPRPPDLQLLMPEFPPPGGPPKERQP
jgi:hypothetical protein